MKKFFTLAAAALMMLSASAETLDLYNGEKFDYYVPVNSQWYDSEGSITQTLYPAADLTAMVGKTINSMTFYTDETGCKMSDGLLNIYLGETELTAFNNAYVTEGLTLVGTATMTKTTDATEITFTFTTPYEYQGGNLILSTEVAQAGGYGMTYFWGVETDNYAGITKAYGNWYPRYFLPHTTFDYGSGDTPEPQGLRGDVNDNHEVTIADVSALIDYLLSNDPTGINMENADCNLQDGITIADVSALIDYLLTNSWD